MAPVTTRHLPRHLHTWLWFTRPWSPNISSKSSSITSAARLPAGARFCIGSLTPHALISASCRQLHSIWMQGSILTSLGYSTNSINSITGRPSLSSTTQDPLHVLWAFTLIFQQWRLASVGLILWHVLDARIRRLGNKNCTTLFLKCLKHIYFLFNVISVVGTSERSFKRGAS